MISLLFLPDGSKRIILTCAFDGNATSVKCNAAKLIAKVQLFKEMGKREDAAASFNE